MRINQRILGITVLLALLTTLALVNAQTLIQPRQIELNMTGHNLTVDRLNFSSGLGVDYGISWKDGNRIYQESSSEIRIVDTLSSNRIYSALPGGTSLVSIGWAADSDTGFYTPGSNILGIVTGTTEQIRVENGTIDIGGPYGDPTSMNISLNGTVKIADHLFNSSTATLNNIALISSTSIDPVDILRLESNIDGDNDYAGVTFANTIRRYARIAGGAQSYGPDQGMISFWTSDSSDVLTEKMRITNDMVNITGHLFNSTTFTINGDMLVHGDLLGVLDVLGGAFVLGNTNISTTGIITPEITTNSTNSTEDLTLSPGPSRAIIATQDVIVGSMTLSTTGRNVTLANDPSIYTTAGALYLKPYGKSVVLYDGTGEFNLEVWSGGSLSVSAGSGNVLVGSTNLSITGINTGVGNFSTEVNTYNLTIGGGTIQTNITMTSPNSNEWCCGVDDVGLFSCSGGSC